MIDSVTNATQPVTASSTQSSSSSGKVLCHTPFGDVLVDELSTTDLKAQFDRRTTGGATDAESAALATTTGQSSSAASSASSVASTLRTNATAQFVAAAQSDTAGSATPAAIATPAAQPTGADTVPTAQSAFGDSPWLSNPTGSGDHGYTWQFNPIYFATDQTAQTIANLVGGTVVTKNAMIGDADGPLHQDEMNNMVQLASGALINPGLVADFYNHGYSQARIDQMIQEEVKGAVAV